MKKEFLKIGIAILVLLGIAIPLSLHREKKLTRPLPSKIAVSLSSLALKPSKK
jgi:energy-converting hydrogenase Eha subunit F